MGQSSGVWVSVCARAGVGVHGGIGFSLACWMTHARVLSDLAYFRFHIPEVCLPIHSNPEYTTQLSEPPDFKLNPGWILA